MRLHRDEREISPEVRDRLAEYNQRICCGVEAFDRKNPIEFYETMDYWSHILRTSRVHRELRQIRTTIFKDHPILGLSDKDGDSKVDSFAYYPESSRRTVEFGFVFDLNEDGKIDYLVFNGGPMMTKDFEAVIWMNYHSMDSNGDGRVDIFIYNDIDLDGDRRPDRGSPHGFMTMTSMGWLTVPNTAVIQPGFHSEENFGFRQKVKFCKKLLDPRMA